MKLSILATIIAVATADITFTRPDKTIGVISSIPGCYGVYPTVKEVKGANGFKLEFYNDWSCKGQKIEEAIGDKVFHYPIQAASIKVSRNTPSHYLRAHREPYEALIDSEEFEFTKNRYCSNGIMNDKGCYKYSSGDFK